VAAVEKAILRIRELGKPAGIMITDLELARHYQELGASLVAIGSDVTLLVAAANSLLEDYKSGGAAKVAAPRGTY
jgi:4-hydroxy-2-oxoheptanedioate aldolase